MRRREIDDSPLGSDSDVPSPSPAPRVAVNLSSMVVKPSASSGGGSDLENGYAADIRRRDSPPPLLRRGSPYDLHRRISPSYGRRRVGSSPMHRRESPDAFRRRVPQSGFRRRGSPMGFPRRGQSPAFHPRSQRFHDNPGYMSRAGFVSPPRRPRMHDDDGYYESYRNHPGGPRPGRGMRGRGGNRFRGVSPPRPGGRGFNTFMHSVTPSSEREFVHRNDPNLSPREGDWICQNPSCGNLNFARRTYCNNCHKYRYDESYGHSPRRDYVSPPHRGPLPRSQAPPPMDRIPRRDFNRYRSPPRGWDTDDDPRELRRGEKFVETVRRDLREGGGGGFRERGRSDWLVAFDSDRRSLSPRYDGWMHGGRERSRSPAGGRLLGDSYTNRGGGDDRRYGGAYAGSPRGYRGRSRSPDLF